MDLDWDALAKAYDMVAAGLAKRIDGEDWKVYEVGSIVRIDIEKSE